MIYPFKKMPLELPRKILLDMWDKPVAALLYSLGTPAKKLMLDNAQWLFRAGRIDRVCVVTSTDWLNATAFEVPDDVEIVFGSSYNEPQELAINESQKLLMMQVWDFDVEHAGAAIENFLHRGNGRSMLIVANGMEFREPMDKKSMILQQISHLADYRRLMLGSLPMLPHQLWSPYKILSGEGPHLLGYPSRAAMRARYEREADPGVIMRRIEGAPTYIMDKEKMDDLPGPIILDWAVSPRTPSPLRQLVLELPPKVVVFVHDETRQYAEWIERTIWEQGNEKEGSVLVLPNHTRPELPSPARSTFKSDQGVRFLVSHAHTMTGRLDCAHAMIYVGHCNDAECFDKCLARVAWNENRHKVAAFRITP